MDFLYTLEVKSIELIGTSLVQGLLCTPSAGGLAWIPGQGTRSHVPQLSIYMLQLKIPRAATETWITNKY